MQFNVRLSAAIALLAFGGIAASPAAAQPAGAAQCGALDNAMGPFDYRQARYMTPRGEYVRPLLKDVELNHFRPEIEGLIKRGNAYFGDDLDYVLRAFPNHHRALVTMARLAKREGKPQPRGAKRVVECYFERALRFAPDDHIARGLYATFLTDAGRNAEAERHLDRALMDAGDHPTAPVTIGILYALNGNTEKALQQAHRAAASGADISVLRRALEGKSAWRDAPPGPGATAAAASQPGQAR